MSDKSDWNKNWTNLFGAGVKKELGADEEKMFEDFKTQISAQHSQPMSTHTNALNTHVSRHLVDTEYDPAFIHFVLDAIIGIYADSILVQPRLLSEATPHLQNTWLICAAAILFTTEKKTHPKLNAKNLIAKNNTVPESDDGPKVPVLWMKDVPSLTGDMKSDADFIVSTDTTHKTAEVKIEYLKSFSQFLDEASLQTKVSEIFEYDADEKADPKWLTDAYRSVVASFDVIVEGFLKKVQKSIKKPGGKSTKFIEDSAAIETSMNVRILPNLDKFNKIVRFVGRFETNLPEPTDLETFFTKKSTDYDEKKRISVATSWVQIVSVSIGNEATVRRVLASDFTELSVVEKRALGEKALGLSRLVALGLTKIPKKHMFEKSENPIDAVRVYLFLDVHRDLPDTGLMPYWFPGFKLGKRDPLEDKFSEDDILVKYDGDETDTDDEVEKDVSSQAEITELKRNFLANVKKFNITPVYLENTSTTIFSGNVAEYGTEKPFLEFVATQVMGVMTEFLGIDVTLVTEAYASLLRGGEAGFAALDAIVNDDDTASQLVSEIDIEKRNEYPWEYIDRTDYGWGDIAVRITSEDGNIGHLVFYAALMNWWKSYDGDNTDSDRFVNYLGLVTKSTLDAEGLAHVVSARLTYDTTPKSIPFNPFAEYDYQFEITPGGGQTTQGYALEKIKQMIGPKSPVYREDSDEGDTE